MVLPLASTALREEIISRFHVSQMKPAACQQSGNVLLWIAPPVNGDMFSM